MADFSQIWWKKTRPLILAHRGANLLAPENTMAAFCKAIEIGADGIELDVRMTLDGVPIVIHNSDVDKTTDGHGSVYDIPLHILQKMDAGSWFDEAFKSQSIPTLEEVLDTIGNDTLINIEIKAHHQKKSNLAEKVCALVNKMSLTNNVWFSSFNANLLHQTRKYSPKIPNGYLYTVHSPVTKFSIRALPLEAVHPHFSVINRKYVERMHRINKRVVTWTVDDLGIARKCFESNVDVIITNDPDKLIQELC